MVIAERTSLLNRKGKRLIPLPAVVNGIFNGIERPSAGQVKYDKVIANLDADRASSIILPTVQNFNKWYGERAAWYEVKDAVLAAGAFVGAGFLAVHQAPQLLVDGALLLSSKKVLDALFDTAQWATHAFRRN